MLKYMLDTNMVVYTMKNRPEQVKKRFNQHKEHMCLSSVTLGELVFGAERSQKTEKNLKDIEAMTARLEILKFGTNEAYHFRRIGAGLYFVGKPIGPYDMMIAAQFHLKGS